MKREVLLISLTIFSPLQSTGSQSSGGRTMMHCAGMDVLHFVTPVTEDLGNTKSALFSHRMRIQHL